MHALKQPYQHSGQDCRWSGFTLTGSLRSADGMAPHEQLKLSPKSAPEP